MKNIEKNLNLVRQQIIQSARQFGRDAEKITLLAVSKRKPAQDIADAFACGQRDFGENYLQEAQQKMSELAHLDICWHFIGAIQSNKTKALAAGFHWVHCIERLKIAKRLSEQRPADIAPLNLCIQVNIDDEPSKAGIALKDVPELATEISGLPRVRLRGLMTIPAPQDDFESQRRSFKPLADMLSELNQRGLDCDTLSMGMSHDMSAAIAEGATLVRIGTAIFGERD